MYQVFDIDAARLIKVRAHQSGHAVTNWNREKHTHPYWEFIYFRAGCGHIHIPGTTLHGHQFFLAIYPPRLPHEEMADNQTPVETMALGIDTPGAPPIGAHLLLPDQTGEMLWLFERILVECGTHFSATETEQPTRLATAYARALLLVIQRAWEQRLVVHHSGIDLIVQYIHAHLAEPITVERLAEVAHVSASTIAHTFSKQFGISPMRYMQHVRIAAAKRLLTTSELPIIDIAHRVGYSDPFHFSRAFKKHAGESPAAYRAAHAGGVEESSKMSSEESDVQASSVMA